MVNGFFTIKTATKSVKLPIRTGSNSNIMRITFIILFYFTIVCSNVKGQTEASHSAKAFCDLPNVVLGAFDTTNCKIKIDTVDQMRSILEMGNGNNGFIQQFIDGGFQYYYQKDTDKNSFPVLEFNFKSKTVFIFLKKNNHIDQILYYDSCKVTEIVFDENGQIQGKYFCDYSKPDNCYDKSYNNGLPRLETD